MINPARCVAGALLLLFGLAGCGPEDHPRFHEEALEDFEFSTRTSTTAEPKETTADGTEPIELLAETSSDNFSTPVGVTGGSPLTVANSTTASSPTPQASSVDTASPRQATIVASPRSVQPSNVLANDSETPPTSATLRTEPEQTADSIPPEPAIEVAQPPPAVAFSDGIVLAADRPAAEPLDLVDDLSERVSWRLYEQIIPFRPECYTTDLATAEVIDFDGEPALMLVANNAQSTASNHALLGRFITSAPVEFGPQQLRVSARVPEQSVGQTQTGPEMSVQITARTDDGRFLTAVFGLQHVAESGTWQVLTGGSRQGAWTPVATATLTPEAWYEIVIDFDTSTNTYEKLTLVGPNGFTVTPIGLTTVWEEKGITSEATWVTLNAENLFTCENPTVTTATMIYRNLSLATLTR